MTELFNVDERVTDPLDRLPLIEELTTGDQYQRSSDAVHRNAEDGRALASPGYVSNIVEVEIDDGEEFASVVDCSKDLGEIYSPSGVLVIPADDFYKFRTTELAKVDGAWKVSNFFTGGDHRCDPDLY